MPSKKEGRRTGKNVQASIPISGALPVSRKNSGTQVTLQHESVEVDKPTMVAEGKQPIMRSASHKSLSTDVSTDEGSSSSRCSSSPSSSEDMSKSPSSHQESNSPEAQAAGCKNPSDSIGQICMQGAPLWVDNGLKGDKTAWLLVLPKVPTDGNTLKRALRSPKNVSLLGPYVSMKNTFLEESRVTRSFQRPRAKSL